MATALNHHNLVVLAWVMVGLIGVVLVAIAAVLMFSQPDPGDVDPEPDAPTDVLHGLAGPARTIRAVLGDFERRVFAEMTREERIIADARARRDAAVEQPTVVLPPIARSPLADAHPRPAPIRVKLTQPEPEVTLPVRSPKRLAIEAAPAEAPTDAAAWRVVPGFAGVDALTFAAVAETFATVRLDGAVVDIGFDDWDLPTVEVDFSATGWTRAGVEALRERMAASARRELVGA